jgi:hypothetical protein
MIDDKNIEFNGDWKGIADRVKKLKYIDR